MTKPAENFDELSQRTEHRRFLFGSGLAVIAIAAVTIAAITFSQSTPSGVAPDAISDVQPIMAGFSPTPDEISSDIEVRDIIDKQLSVHG